MNNKENPEQEALRGEDELMAFLVKELQSEKFQASRQKAAEGPHPSSEMLYRYVLDESDAPEARMIREHIAFCKMCADELLQIRQIEENMEERLSEWLHRTEISLPPPASPPKADLLEVVAVEWEPEGAGEQLVAADASMTQEHEFDTDIGLIKLICAWGRAVNDEPAFLWLSWDADITKESEFLIRINPENLETHYEVRPGTIRKGEHTITRDDLGFDPSEEKWGIAIIIPKQNKTKS